jgi:hypothetical protein
MIIYSKDDPKYANDLSFMTEKDWERYEKIRKEKEHLTLHTE